MTSPREMLQRIRSVRNIAQVTRALEAVSASRVRKAEARAKQTRPYARKSWQVLRHLSQQPGRNFVHPLLTKHSEIRKAIVILISGDRGLAGAYNANVIRYALEAFRQSEISVGYITVGRKGRDILLRRRKKLLADFSNLPEEPSFLDVSAIGRLAIDEFLAHRANQVWLIYTTFVSMMRQAPTSQLLLPFEFEETSIGQAASRVQMVDNNRADEYKPTYVYEPAESTILDRIIPRLVELQIFQAITESLASEHAARMIAMRYATENANELAEALNLEYNKARQKAITNDMLDIVGGAEALTSS